MIIYNLQYNQSNVPIIKRDVITKIIFMFLFIVNIALIWLIAMINLNKKDMLSFDEWIVTSILTFFCIIMIVIQIMAITNDKKLIKSLFSSTTFEQTEIRFFAINEKTDFLIAYNCILYCLTFTIALLTSVAIITRAIKGQLNSLFLMLLIFLTICGLNTICHTRIKRKLDKNINATIIKSTVKEKEN